MTAVEEKSRLGGSGRVCPECRGALRPQGRDKGAARSEQFHFRSKDRGSIGVLALDPRTRLQFNGALLAGILWWNLGYVVLLLFSSPYPPHSKEITVLLC